MENIKYVDPRPTDSKPCYYSMTSDENFILDFHPDTNNIVFVGGFSGHGFKFAPLIGTIVKELVLDGKTSYQISQFNL